MSITTPTEPVDDAGRPTFRLARTGYAAASDELRYDDATGAYDEDENPTGYGGPNGLRGEYALFLVGELVRADAAPGAVVGAPADDAASPLTRTGFRLRPGADGYVRAHLLAFPALSTAALNLIQADMLAHPGTHEGEVYYEANGPRGLLVARAGHFVSTTPVEQAAAPVATAHEALTPRGTALRDRLLERVAALYYDGVPEPLANAQDQYLLRLYAACKALLRAADICWQRNLPYLFQLRVERLAALAAEATPLLA